MVVNRNVQLCGRSLHAAVVGVRRSELNQRRPVRRVPQRVCMSELLRRRAGLRRRRFQLHRHIVLATR